MRSSRVRAGGRLPRMRPGQSIAVVAPSFFIEKHDHAERGLRMLRERGYSLRLASTLFQRFENTTGRARERVDDLHACFADDRIGAIICTDGGARALELVPHLDYELIERHPKLLSGFSDITHLLLAIAAKTGMPTLHGLDIVNGFGAPPESPHYQANVDWFWRLTSAPCGDVPRLTPWTVWRPGRATGVLVGGWLDAVMHLAGTEYFPVYDRMILFWEAIALETNQMLMRLNALRLMPWFHRVQGMVVGKLTDCQE